MASMVDNISRMYCKGLCWEGGNSDGGRGKGRVSPWKIPIGKKESVIDKR